MSDATKDLEGAELDLAVVRALGYRFNGYDDPYDGCDLKDEVVDDHRHFMPSVKWMHGGPIISREKIALWYDQNHHRPDGRCGAWLASVCVSPRDEEHKDFVAMHPTLPLVAAMRAFVASKAGE